MKYLKLYEEYNIESDKNKKQTIFLFGPQGVGKTTICKLLSSKLNMKIIESDEQEFESYDVGDDSNWSDVWNQRKESEFKTIKNYLEKYKNSSVILDIGGSHGVWEGKQLDQIKSIIKDCPNKFLIVPYKDLEKSQLFLRERVLGREIKMNSFNVEYWEAILSSNEKIAEEFLTKHKFDGENKNKFMEYFTYVKNEPGKYRKIAEEQRTSAKKRVDGLTDNLKNNKDEIWMVFNIDDKTKKFNWDHSKIEDYAEYFIQNMSKSGIANHLIYLEDRTNEEVVEEIIEKSIE